MTLSQRSKNAVALAAVCLVALMFGLEISSVPVILPTLQRVLRGSFKDMQWTMNAYTIACTTVLMATGTLADRFGRRRVLLGSVALFGLTSLACGLAWSAPALIVSRFLQGMSAGAMLICQVAILSHQFQDGRERGRAFGTWGIVFGIGLGFGPIIGGGIAALAGWKWVFLVHVLLAAVAVGLVRASVEESRNPHATKLDIAGMITLSLAVFGLVYFITQGPELGLTSRAGLGLACAVAAGFVVFVRIERAQSQPMFDFSVFKVRNFSGALLGSTGMNFSFWPFMIYLPIYFQSGLGYRSIAAGLALLAYTLPTLLLPPLGERLMLRHRPGLVIPAGLFTIGLGFVLMRLGAGAAHPSWLTMLPGCVVAGMGLGITNTPVTNTATGAIDSARAGMASGIDMSARLISLAVNIALMGFILVQAIAARLRDLVAAPLDGDGLRALAERVAAGALGTSALDAAAARAAFIHGAGVVMLYGGVAVWLLAAASYLVFRPAPAAR